MLSTCILHRLPLKFPGAFNVELNTKPVYHCSFQSLAWLCLGFAFLIPPGPVVLSMRKHLIISPKGPLRWEEVDVCALHFRCCQVEFIIGLFLSIRESGWKKERGFGWEVREGDWSLTGGPEEIGPSSIGNHYGNTIALSGIMQRRGRGHAGKGRKQHDVDAFFLDAGRSPQKSKPGYFVTRAVLWSRESPKAVMSGMECSFSWCGHR